ncbi:MAG: DUF805 domain-containing protein [Flavobacteriales bacterium]|nr:DUF805 domain-containing protein [Flavobacteriales bacterium]
MEFAIASVLLLALAIALGVLYSGTLPPWYLCVIYVPALWLFLAQGVKRCHDLGKPWWWFMIPFYILVMLLVRGEQRQNKYGVDPKG